VAKASTERGRGFNGSGRSPCWHVFSNRNHQVVSSLPTGMSGSCSCGGGDTGRRSTARNRRRISSFPARLGHFDPRRPTSRPPSRMGQPQRGRAAMWSITRHSYADQRSGRSAFGGRQRRTRLIVRALPSDIDLEASHADCPHPHGVGAAHADPAGEAKGQ